MSRLAQSDWPAPAKLNLFLHVTGRRADGYHTLQTVFQFLDYGDTLRFRVRPDAQVGLTDPLPSVPPEQDLCVRAAKLLQTETGTRLGAEISVIKRLPMGGGLGGGSSDAATTLLALSTLWGLGLDLDRLAALGLKLGADVPVFVHGRACWAEGIGEATTPIDLPEPWYLVIVPPPPVSTARVFAALELTACSPPITIRDFHGGQGQNDLAPVTRRLYPEVAKALDWLGGFGPARMTGSGGCVFLALPDAAQAEQLARICPAELGQTIVARGCNRHPLHRLLSKE